MAYDIYVHSAFNQTEETPEGYTYLTIEEALSNLVDVSLGVLYSDEEGNIVYESRNRRTL